MGRPLSFKHIPGALKDAGYSLADFLFYCGISLHNNWEFVERDPDLQRICEVNYYPFITQHEPKRAPYTYPEIYRAVLTFVNTYQFLKKTGIPLRTLQKPASYEYYKRVKSAAWTHYRIDLETLLKQTK
jgi:hypothetical protein